MKTTAAAVVFIFSLFMVCGVILTVLRERETAAMLFTSGISFLMGCGITVMERAESRDKRIEERNGGMF